MALTLLQNFCTRPTAGTKGPSMADRWTNLADPRVLQPKTHEEHLSQQVLEAYKLLSGWVGSMADRVRNPVAGVLAALRLLERELQQVASGRPLNEAFAKDVLHKVTGRLIELDRYIAELTDFGRPAVCIPQEFPIRPLLQSVCDEFRKRPGMRTDLDIHLTCNPYLVNADPEKIERMLQALLLNSIEAIPATSIPQISVRIISETMANTLKIIVTDNGPGFPGKAQEHLLRPFSSTKEAGSGLGLAIVKKYAESHQGYVELKNLQGDGTGAQVTIVLPGAVRNNGKSVF
jgi:signal transduction histidine kinase